MKSYQEAQTIILNNQINHGSTQLSILESLGHVLSKDIETPLNFPSFNSSAMDGYAIKHQDISNATDENPIYLTMIDDIWAGKTKKTKIESGTCARIMTGACVPSDTDAVVPKENIEVSGSTIKFTEPTKNGANIRFCGEEIKCGEKILTAGTIITPSIIGILASLGLEKVTVCSPPRVSIISTGSELVQPGITLKENQIYDSNSLALASALKKLNFSTVLTGPLVDDPAIIRNALLSSFEQSTHIIICGGVSVGEYDHNKSVLNDLGVKTEFWKINQKPGKPFFYGTYNQVHVFGVPGNPVSAMICFYEYIQPALLKFSGCSFQDIFLDTGTAILNNAITKNDDKTHFLRGIATKTNGEIRVSALNKQGSHMMTSLAKANCLIVLSETCQSKSTGESVEIQWLS